MTTSRYLLPAIFLVSTFACTSARAEVPVQQPTRVVAPAQADASIDSAALRIALAQRRTRHLQQLLAYANAGEFPQNHVSNGPINLFIDDSGHLCAAANLIDLDGHGKLVKKTAADNNYIMLSTVKSGPLMDWMLTSGFTQEEIAQIQEPYMPITDLDDQPFEGPQPQFATAPLSADEERTRVQNVLRGVHKVLAANTAKSLSLASQRLAANPWLASAVLTGPQVATL